jgi:hypothetical protein
MKEEEPRPTPQETGQQEQADVPPYNPDESLIVHEEKGRDSDSTEVRDADAKDKD